MEIRQLELNDYLPDNWRIEPSSIGLRLIAPSAIDCQLFHEGARNLLKKSAKTLGAILLAWEGCAEPIRIEGSKSESKRSDTSSNAPSRIDPSASYEAVQDFVIGQRAAGRIVTIMSMNDRNPALNDKFLMVNDLQVQHRAGGWGIHQWVGSDAKATVWYRSFDGTLPACNFRPSGHNYYHELVSRIRAGEHYIPDFDYLIDRPNGAGLWHDTTSYHFVEEYCGCAIRIAVSDPKHAELVQAYDS